ncbi:efflux RND transporter permease subunit [Luteimonas sp. R10]|uniref:efflux RND transporter permease subunit n=1 Tax=Luteimonas sp. R10 TaxID=3108176 RepID=UPI00388EF245
MNRASKSGSNSTCAALRNFGNRSFASARNVAARCAISISSSGTGGGFRAPMATVVIGGLIVATVLSLLTTPALFLAVESLYVRLRRVRSPAEPFSAHSR